MGGVVGEVPERLRSKPSVVCPVGKHLLSGSRIWMLRVESLQPSSKKLFALAGRWYDARAGRWDPKALWSVQHSKPLFAAVFRGSHLREGKASPSAEFVQAGSV